MSDILEFLQQRNSAPKLTEPGPSEGELTAMITAAIRAPDHAWLRPWRFVVIAGERREDFGAVLEASLLQRQADADEAALSKARKAPLRAPVVVAVVVSVQAHPKVPAVEQRLSAGCAAHGLLLAAQALGFAGVWRTGDAAFDRQVMDSLGLETHEELVGFVYLGTRDGKAKPLPTLAPEDYITHW